MRRPGDDGPDRDEQPDGPDRFDPQAFVIPNDLRELRHEVRAFRREERRNRRGRHARRWLPDRLRNPSSGPLFVTLMVLAAFAGSLLVLLNPVGADVSTPNQHPLAPAASLSSPPTELLPTAAVLVGGAQRQLRDLRPAAFALLPADCSCQEALRTVHSQAKGYGMALYLVGVAGQESQLRTTATQIGSDASAVVVDDTRALATAVRARGLTLVLVHSDGMVGTVVRSMPGGLRLEPLLARLLLPGATVIAPAPSGPAGPAPKASA